jgi:uncharacterized damage-inducible protein DinB
MGLPESTWLRLKTQLDCLPTLLAGIAEGALERKPSPDKWSARENLAHLARYQKIFLGRLNRMGAEDGPVLLRYRAEDDPEWPLWMDCTESEIFDSLQGQRKELIQKIERLSDGELARTGTHSRFGEMSITQWVEFFLLHEAHHLLIVMQRTRQD